MPGCSIADGGLPGPRGRLLLHELQEGQVALARDIDAAFQDPGVPMRIQPCQDMVGTSITGLDATLNNPGACPDLVAKHAQRG